MAKMLKANSQNNSFTGDELVGMVPKASTNINNIIVKKINTITLAVKYANMMTIKCLLRAGSNLRQLEKIGHACMHSKLEHPMLFPIKKIVRRIGYK